MVFSVSSQSSSSSEKENDVNKTVSPAIDAIQAVEDGDLWTASSLSEEQLELIYSHLNDHSFEEWLAILEKAVYDHNADPLLSPYKLAFLDGITKSPLPGQSEEDWKSIVAFEAFVVHEWSIYPEVRNVTMPIDEPGDDDYLNVRVYVISCFWAMAGACVDTFFSMRSPGITISTNALQVLIAGCGHLWALLPEISFPVGFGKRVVLNNGKKWTFKEQMLATLGMSVAVGSPYARHAIIAQGNKYFYNLPKANSFGYMITLTLSSTFMGFGFGGLFRSTLVYPARLAWFWTLSALPMSRVFTQPDIRENINGWRLKRGEFFGLVVLISFGWYWIVTNLLSFLSMFNWMCYIAPNNVNVNAITGQWTGIGLNPFPSFDFSIIGNFGGILTPVFAEANSLAGTFIGAFAVMVIWYCNLYETGYFPISSSILYNNEAKSYSIYKILDRSTMLFDMNKYQEYSTPYWTATQLVTYGADFMIFTMGITYSALNYGKFLVSGFKTMSFGLQFWKRDGKRAIDLYDDSFSRRQARYREVPEWVYFMLLVISFGIGVGCVEGYTFTDTPVWTIILGIGIAFIFVPVSGIMEGVAGYGFSINTLFELLIGLAKEGHDQTQLVAKCFATSFLSQTDNWLSNQKIAHYSGISPWAIFTIQCLSTFMVCFVQVGIIYFQLNGGIHDMCDPKNREYFRCNGVRSYFNASVVWGVIGTRRMFSGTYSKMKWCFLIGAFVPVPLWAWRKLGPELAKRWRLHPESKQHMFVSGRLTNYINEMVLCTGATSPTFGSMFANYWIHLVFQLYIRARYPRWWSKYAYLIIAGLSMGTGWAGFLNFWATQYHHIVNVNAWTNNVVSENMDYNFTAVRKKLKKGDYFGPRRGTFPR